MGKLDTEYTGKPDYYDSLSTVERMTHSAILKRHDYIDKQLQYTNENIARLGVSIVEAMCLAQEFETKRRLNSRIGWLYRWLKLI